MANIKRQIKNAEEYIDHCRSEKDFYNADLERNFWRKLGFQVKTINNKTTIKYQS